MQIFVGNLILPTSKYLLMQIFADADVNIYACKYLLLRKYLLVGVTICWWANICCPKYLVAGIANIACVLPVPAAP